MPTHDVTRRFVVVYHGWPVDSSDDEDEAHARMRKLRDTQLQSWRGRWPLHGFDNTSLWKVQDMAKRP